MDNVLISRGNWPYIVKFEQETDLIVKYFSVTWLLKMELMIIMVNREKYQGADDTLLIGIF